MHCVIVIYSIVAVVFSIAFLVFFISFSGFSKFALPEECLDKTKELQVIQHGHYWVLLNYIEIEPRRKLCSDDYSIGLAMQGNYEDIYNLLYLYTTVEFETRSSMAIYIRDMRDFNETIRAIKYVRRCSIFPPEDGGNLIRQYVSFHLYFRYDQLTADMYTLPLYKMRKMLVEKVDETCDRKLESGKINAPKRKQKESEEQLEQHAIIVGKNIAQLAAHTDVLLYSDVDTYPNNKLDVGFTLSLSYNTKQFKDSHVLALPIFYFDDFNANDHLLRVDRSFLITSFRSEREVVRRPGDPFASGSWLSGIYLTQYKPDNISIPYQLFLDYANYLIGTRRLPLLLEYADINVTQSENLRIFQMHQRNFTYSVPNFIYLLKIFSDTEMLKRDVIKSVKDKVNINIDTFVKQYRRFGK